MPGDLNNGARTTGTRRIPSVQGLVIRALIGIALIIFNVISGRYVLGILGALFLMWTVANLLRRRNVGARR